MALQKVLTALGGIVKALRLALPKIGVAWMFALLSSNFNRITIYELGVAAVLVTVMLSMHNFLSPFQVVFGRIADRHPVFGLRRTPYIIISAFLGSLIFTMLPAVAHGMGTGSPTASLTGLVLMLLFGICIATLGDSHHSLIAESTSERSRGGVISIVWTFTILSSILSAVIFKNVMPVYSPEAMQQLYNLTPFVVLISTILGVVGIERRIQSDELQEVIARSRAAVPQGNALATAYRLLKTNHQVRSFFFFVSAAILGIFLQDSILEVYGAEVFGMSLQETTGFQQIWGGAVLLGMLLMGIVSSVVPISKKMIAMIGASGTAFGLGMLMLSALLSQQALLTPALMVMGLFTGLFNIGALSMMMEMTVEGATGLYMGMWGCAQSLGNGMASVVSGAMKTALIETGLTSPQIGYSAIFGVETLLMVVAVTLLSTVSIAEFKGLKRQDLARAMEVGATA